MSYVKKQILPTEQMNCVCMYVCMYVRTYVCMCVFMYVSVCVCTYVCVCVCVYISFRATLIWVFSFISVPSCWESIYNFNTRKNVYFPENMKFCKWTRHSRIWINHIYKFFEVNIILLKNEMPPPLNYSTFH